MISFIYNTLYTCIIYWFLKNKKDNDKMSFKNAKSSIKFCSKQLLVYLLKLTSNSFHNLIIRSCNNISFYLWSRIKNSKSNKPDSSTHKPAWSQNWWGKWWMLGRPREAAYNPSWRCRRLPSRTVAAQFPHHPFHRAYFDRSLQPFGSSWLMLQSPCHGNSSTNILSCHAILELCFSRPWTWEQMSLHSFSIRLHVYHSRLGMKPCMPSSLDPWTSRD